MLSGCTGRPGAFSWVGVTTPRALARVSRLRHLLVGLPRYPPIRAVMAKHAGEPFLQLEALGTAASGRKLRLFAVACSRRVLSLYHLEPSRQAVLVAELFADGRADARQLQTARQEAGAVSIWEAEVGWVTAMDRPLRAASFAALESPLDAARAAAGWAAEEKATYEGWKAVRKAAWAAVKKAATAG